MTPRMHDVTAGRRALEKQDHPETPRAILDPTDPRYGQIEPGVDERPSGETRGDYAPRPR